MTEFHHGGIFEIKLADIHPARINDVIYKPVNAEDSTMMEFAAKIAGVGLEHIDPIVITTDNVIVSGHRRRVAYQILGFEFVRVRRLPIHSGDPRFPELLVGFNAQRDKTADEIFREELVRLNPVEAHQRLVAHRRKAVALTVETMAIIGTKRRAVISKAKLPMLDAIIKVIDENRDYWPLSDRLIHYRLLNDPPLKHASKPDSRYANDKQSYDSLTEILTRARLKEIIPFEAIHDPTRPVSTWRVFPGVRGFMQEELQNFMQGYFRDLQKSQPLHVEMVGEKNTVESTIRPLAEEFTIPLTIARGYVSIPPRREMVRRFLRSGKDKLLILYVADFDPEGDDIAHSFTRSIRDDFGIGNVEGVRATLTNDQAQEMKLPKAAIAKAGSSRRKEFVKRHGGEHVWELEAVPPGRLQTIVCQKIESVLDMNLFGQEERREADDAAHLEAIRIAMSRQLSMNFNSVSEPEGGDR